MKILIISSNSGPPQEPEPPRKCRDRLLQPPWRTCLLAIHVALILLALGALGYMAHTGYPY